MPILNKKEVISQGYLESYLTQDLTPEDLAEVENYIKEDVEVRRSYAEVQQMMENLSFQYAILPSPVLKNLVLSEVSSQLQTKAHPWGLWRLMAAASIVIAIASVFSAFHFWNKWKTTDQELSALTAQNIMMAEQLNQVNSELGDIKNDLAILISPEFSRIILNGTDNAPNAKAVIYWNQSQEKVFLHATSLAGLPQNQQYQLWAIIDGNPVDAGVFDGNMDSFVEMRNISNADAFAVTIEKSGGSPTPTLSTMQVIGNISS